jgi:cilia- and flagella-associated protein 44
MIFIAGICYIIYNINTHEVKKYFTKDGGGIGSIAVHPDKNYFAVCEKGDSPNVYIYEYPSLKLYRILRKGTERSYSNADFSQSGSMLATVGSYPDYLLCVWDWKQE